jgi:hypothetical protein
MIVEGQSTYALDYHHHLVKECKEGPAMVGDELYQLELLSLVSKISEFRYS